MGDLRVLVVGIALGIRDEGTGWGSVTCINVVNHLLPIDAEVHGHADRVITRDGVSGGQGDASPIQGFDVFRGDVFCLGDGVSQLGFEHGAVAFADAHLLCPSVVVSVVPDDDLLGLGGVAPVAVASLENRFIWT